MSFHFENIDNPIINKVATQQILDKYCWVTAPTPQTPLGRDWNYQPCVINPLYERLAQRVRNFTVKSDDVWLISYPKSGTTWCQEMIWLLCNNLDYERAKGEMLNSRFPFLEIEGLRDMARHVSSFNNATNMPSPRLIKTHLPVALVPDQLWTVAPKIVYIRRNPKDVAVSYFHHTAMLHDYTGNMEDFVEAFIADLAYYSPYHSHVLEYNEVAGKCDNVLMLKFEEMKLNLEENVRKTAKFLNKTYSDEQLTRLCEHLSFKEMRKNESLNYESTVKKILERNNRTVKDTENFHFIRKGEAGGWRKELSAALAEKIDAWTKTKVLTDEGRQLFNE